MTSAPARSVGLLFLTTIFALAQIYVDPIPVEHPAIRYETSPTRDPVAELVRRLAATGARVGSLTDLLSVLGIARDSQMLVFSKGSVQGAKISPRNPRALYFDDNVVVASVPGGDGIELASTDPQQGIIFYVLKESQFTRRTDCLHCHQGPATLGVPGVFVGSVFPNADGVPARGGAIITDHRTRFEDRWGGWYVSGTHGEQRHRGNAIAPDPVEPEILETAGTQNLTSLAGKFKPLTYLTPDSDIVALMTLEHQTQMINRITRLGWRERISGPVSEAELNDFVAYLTFADEALLHEPVRGVSSFAVTFPRRGPRDTQDRSLRDFDLQTRLFRYPASYLIYSAQFQALPSTLRQRIYARMCRTLSSSESGTAALEILRETKPDFACGEITP